MPIIGNIERPVGRGVRKLFCGTVSITGTGSVSTGLSAVEYAVVSVANAETTIPSNGAEISSISGGTINIVVVNYAAAANSISTAAKDISVMAVGY